MPAPDRALRRHGREVHRRRGDGGLGHADRDRGRRRARRPRGARPGRRRVGARRRGRRAGASRPCRRPHRRGRGHARRRRPGHGRRRPRQHRVARPVGRRARAPCSSASRRGARPSRRSSTRTRARSSSRARKGSTPLWRALRVVSGLRGSLKSPGLEAPFVGRDRELRQIKDLFHASRRRAQGAPRLGRPASPASASRGSRGSSTSTSTASRRPSTGTAAAASPTARASTYWALADMVRMRCRIAEDEEPASALRQAARDARGAHPRRRGAQLRRAPPRAPARAGRATRRATGRTSSPPGGSSSSGSPSSYPTVLVFEDMQWADASLLDFVEYLLDWSRSHPIFVVTLARPELLERRPDLGRRAAELHVALPRAALASGDGGAARRPRARASRTSCATRSSRAPRACRCTRSRRCGCCSTAACSCRRAPPTGSTGRDRGARGPGDAARADRRAARRPVRRTSGGCSRTPPCSARRSRSTALAALVGLPEAELEPLLAALVRKEVLGVQADPRSPEHGQYGFLQDLVQRRRLRDALEAGAACPAPRRRRAPERGVRGDEDEVVEVIASHYLAAYEAAPDADDAAEIKGKARAMLARAGERAASLARRRRGAALLRAGGGARGRAARRRRHSSSRAGEMAARAGEPDAARRLFEESIALYEAARRHARRRARAVRSSARLDVFTGRRDEAMARMERAFAVISADEPDEDLALLAARLVLRILVRRRSRARGRVRGDRAGHRRGPRVPDGTRDCAAGESSRRGHSRGHRRRRCALVKHALQMALDHDVARRGERRATSGSPTCCFQRDEYADALAYLDESIALARKTRRPPARMGCAGRADPPALHARSLGRGAGGERRVHRRSSSTPVDSC